jgi:hypothetical protein
MGNALGFVSLAFFKEEFMAFSSNGWPKLIYPASRQLGTCYCRWAPELGILVKLKC